MELIHKAHRGQFLKSLPVARNTDDGRSESAAPIRKMHRQGPQRPDALIKGRDGPRRSRSIDAVRKALRHPHGIGPLAHMEVNLDAIERGLRKHATPEFSYGELLRRKRSTGQSIEVVSRIYHEELRKGTAKPRANDIEVHDNEPRRPNSSNAQWDDVHADTGASNDWHDQITPKTKPTRLPFKVNGTPSKSNLDAAVDAIKQDMARSAKRMGG